MWIMTREKVYLGEICFSLCSKIWEMKIKSYNCVEEKCDVLSHKKIFLEFMLSMRVAVEDKMGINSNNKPKPRGAFFC